MTGRMLATKTFAIEHDFGGEVVNGQFTAKRLSAADIAREAVLRAQYRGGLAVDPADEDRAFLMARLTTSLVQVPSWWSWDAMPEDPIETDGVALKVYAEVKKFHDSFRRPSGPTAAVEAVGKPGNGVGEGGAGAGGAQHTQPGSLGSGAGVLSGGVSSPLDP